jgi:hypothetical protein
MRMIALQAPGSVEHRFAVPRDKVPAPPWGTAHCLGIHGHCFNPVWRNCNVFSCLSEVHATQRAVPYFTHPGSTPAGIQRSLRYA